MFTCRICGEFTLILHHNGKLIQNANGALEYVSGEFCIWEDIETDLVNVWTTHKLCKACRNYVKFALVCYLVLDSGLQRLKLGLLIQKKKMHVDLKLVKPQGGPVKEIGPKIEVDVLSLNCNAKKVVKVVPEDSTQNGIEDMDVDGANGVGKGGPVAKIEVVRVETLANVQDAETEVVYVSPEDDGQTSDTSNDGYHFEEFESSQQ